MVSRACGPLLRKGKTWLNSRACSRVAHFYSTQSVLLARRRYSAESRTEPARQSKYQRLRSRIRISLTATRSVPNALSLNRLQGASWLTA